MTKLRTVGVVAAFIAACGAGGFIAGAALDERCRTDTATKGNDDTLNDPGASGPNERGIREERQRIDELRGRGKVRQ